MELQQWRGNIYVQRLIPKIRFPNFHHIDQKTGMSGRIVPLHII